MNSLSYLGSPRFLFVFWHAMQEHIFLKGTFLLEVKWSVYAFWEADIVLPSVWQTIKSGLKPPGNTGDVLLLQIKAGCAHTQNTRPTHNTHPTHTHKPYVHTLYTYTAHKLPLYIYTPPIPMSHTHPLHTHKPLLLTHSKKFLHIKC